ncbi:MAG: hypothetical protein ABSE73_26805 [Planctomycetota bacterium]
MTSTKPKMRNPQSAIPNPYRALACLALVWACGNAAAEQLPEAGPSKPKDLASSASQKGGDDGLAKLKSEIRARQRAWADMLERETPGDNEEMLKGLSEKVYAQARDLAGNPETLRTALQRGVSVGLLLAVAAQRNPEVRAAYQNWRAAVRHFDQAWYLEELVARSRAAAPESDPKEAAPVRNKETPGKTYATPAVLALKGQLLDVETELAQLRYRQAQRKAINAIAQQCVEIQHAAKVMTTLCETRTLFSQLAQNAQGQVEAGKALQPDTLRAASELAMLDNRMARAELEWKNLVGRANIMLALPSGTQWGGLADTDLAAPKADPEQAAQRARENSSKALIAQKETELMRLMVRMARLEFLLRGQRSATPAVAEKLEAANFSAVNAAYLEELEVRLKEAEEMKEAAKADAEQEAAVALSLAEAAQQEWKSFSERILPLDMKAYDAAKTRHSSGETFFIDVLDAARTYLRDALLKEDAQRDFRKALINLQDAQGSTASRLMSKGDTQSRTDAR